MPDVVEVGVNKGLLGVVTSWDSYLTVLAETVSDAAAEHTSLLVLHLLSVLLPALVETTETSGMMADISNELPAPASFAVAVAVAAAEKAAASVEQTEPDVVPVAMLQLATLLCLLGQAPSAVEEDTANLQAEAPSCAHLLLNLALTAVTTQTPFLDLWACHLRVFVYFQQNLL